MAALRKKYAFIDFILKEWLLVASGVGLALTSLLTMRLPRFSEDELGVLLILFALFMTVKGLQESGLIANVARRIEQGRAIPLKLVLGTFFLAMLMTNDVALVVMVPLTLSLQIRRKDIIVILEALAANAGSALMPFGNPQNLYLYWHYRVGPVDFISTIAPFSLAFLVLLAGAAWVAKTENSAAAGTSLPTIHRIAWGFSVLFLILILVILHVLPLFVAVLVILAAAALDRRALRVDYAILVTFLLFFGITDNLRYILTAELHQAGHVFLLSALISQFISNVPAALLFAEFTPHWQALLWGVNAGGFGSLVASLANLIAYKFYLADGQTKAPFVFTIKFMAMGFMALAIAILLYGMRFGLGAI